MVCCYLEDLPQYLEHIRVGTHTRDDSRGLIGSGRVGSGKASARTRLSGRASGGAITGMIVNE